MPLTVLSLFGPVRLTTPDGRELTPSSLKARGLLALLGVAPQHRMARPSLIDRLWSDRDEKRGGDSLRQALKALREAAGPDLLEDGNGWVGLNPAAVRVDLSAPCAGLVGGEFAADLDGIRDPEFVDWLRDTRLHLDAAPPAGRGGPEHAASRPAAVPRSPLFLVAPTRSGELDLQLYGDMVLREATARAAQLCNADVEETAEAGDGRRATLSVSAIFVAEPRRVIFQPSVRPAGVATEPWSQTFSAPRESLPDLAAEASASITATLVGMLGGLDDTSAELAGHVPFADAFSFDQRRLLRADETLKRLFEESGRAPLLAMRAFVRHTLIMERHDPDPHARLAEAEQMIRDAQQRAPHSAFVNAMASLIHGVCGRDLLAMDLAREAFAADPNHAFVRHCLSVALSFDGQADAAHREALAAQKNRMTALTSPITYLRNAYTAIGVGDHKQALEWAERAVGSAPDFRAAIRVVAALRYTAHDEAGAHAALRQLKALEQDFTLDLLESDDYPVDTLRSAGLLQIAKSSLL